MKSIIKFIKMFKKMGLLQVFTTILNEKPKICSKHSFRIQKMQSGNLKTTFVFLKFKKLNFFFKIGTVWALNFLRSETFILELPRFISD